MIVSLVETTAIKNSTFLLQRSVGSHEVGVESVGQMAALGDHERGQRVVGVLVGVGGRGGRGAAQGRLVDGQDLERELGNVKGQGTQVGQRRAPLGRVD